MDIKLKHRLVGACVILALAVFFLPMILDSEKYSHEIESQIPEDSVLKDSSNESQAKQQGSLTINLDEEEPEKAIITQEKPEPTVSESPSSEPKDSESTSPESTSPESTESSKSEQQLSEPENSSEPEKTEDPENIASDKPQSKTDTAAAQKDSSKTQADSEQESKQQEQAENQAKTPKKKQPQEDKGDVSLPTPSDNKPQFEQNAWVIQIGSFSNKENATTLVSELRTKGYRAYLRQSGEYSRVFVGPYPDKDAAESRTEDLAKIVGAAVKVIEFDPQSH